MGIVDKISAKLSGNDPEESKNSTHHRSDNHHFANHFKRHDNIARKQDNVRDSSGRPDFEKGAVVDHNPDVGLVSHSEKNQSTPANLNNHAKDDTAIHERQESNPSQGISSVPRSSLNGDTPATTKIARNTGNTPPVGTNSGLSDSVGTSYSGSKGGTSSTTSNTRPGLTGTVGANETATTTEIAHGNQKEGVAYTGAHPTTVKDIDPSSPSRNAGFVDGVDAQPHQEGQTNQSTKLPVESYPSTQSDPSAQSTQGWKPTRATQECQSTQSTRSGDRRDQNFIPAADLEASNASKAASNNFEGASGDNYAVDSNLEHWRTGATQSARSHEKDASLSIPRSVGSVAFTAGNSDIDAKVEDLHLKSQQKAEEVYQKGYRDGIQNAH